MSTQKLALASERGPDSTDRTNRTSNSTPTLHMPPHTVGPTPQLSHTSVALVDSLLSSSRVVRGEKTLPLAGSNHMPPGCWWELVETAPVLLVSACVLASGTLFLWEALSKLLKQILHPVFENCDIRENELFGNRRVDAME